MSGASRSEILQAAGGVAIQEGFFPEVVNIKKAFSEMTYYERWMASITNTLLETGIITTEELGSKMREIKPDFFSSMESR